MYDSKVRLLFLDTTRGIAALIVLIAHMRLAFYPGEIISASFSALFDAVFNARLAVLYFFVHSGFILTHHYRNLFNELTARNIRHYLIRRAFRIYPLFLVTLISGFLLTRLMGPAPFAFADSTWLKPYWTTHFSLSGLFGQSLLLIRIPEDPNMRILPVDWTLSLELALSLMLPFIIRKNAWIAWTGTFVAAQFLGLDRFVIPFASGMFLAMKINSFNYTTSIRYGSILAAIIFLFLSHLIPGAYYDMMERILLVPEAFGCALLLFALLKSGSLQHVLSIRPGYWIGRSSYGIYLIQIPVIFCFYHYFHHDFSPLLSVTMVTSVVLALSFLCYQFIERPVIQLGKRLQ